MWSQMRAWGTVLLSPRLDVCGAGCGWVLLFHKYLCLWVCCSALECLTPLPVCPTVQQCGLSRVPLQSYLPDVLEVFLST